MYYQLQNSNGLKHLKPASERAKIKRTIFLNLAAQMKSRKGVIHACVDIGIKSVVC